MDIPDDIYEAALQFMATDKRKGNETSHDCKLNIISSFAAGAMWERGLVTINN